MNSDAKSAVGSTASRPTGVLVVDDHALIRCGVCRTIEAEPGFRLVGEADGPAAALDLAERTAPDLAVVDLTYPDGGTGFDLIRDLRVRCPNCRVVAFTATDGPGYAEQCLRAGAVGFVSKGEPAGHLVAAIKAARDGRTYVSQDRAGDLLARLSRGGADPARPAIDTLSPGEFQVYHLIGQGLSNRQIAAALHRSVKTVETYRSRIKRKIGADNATQLAQMAAGACPAGDAPARPGSTVAVVGGGGAVALPGRPPAPAFGRPASPAGRVNVLVVEDHAEIRRPMAKLLRLRGYDAREAADGILALAALEAAPADVVLLDLMMPNMGGLALLERLRADARWRTLPVVVVTGSSDEVVLDQVRALTGHLVIKASCDPEVLFARVDAAVSAVSAAAAAAVVAGAGVYQ